MHYRTTYIAMLSLASPAWGHHSEAGIDLNSVVTFEGTVTEFSWRNPHVYLAAETTNERGEPVEWVLQLGSTITAGRLGWTRESLSTGDRVTVRVHPAQDGRPYGIAESVEIDGEVVSGTRRYLPDVTARTTTLEGIWMADTSKLPRYPGGFDGFFNAQLVLTKKGQTAQATYDELSAENPDSTCIGRPTPALIVSSNLYPLGIQFNDDETIVIRSEAFDEIRTVYMDGRNHPEISERFLVGHSTGRWEGDVLVVDTRNFTDHRSPYQIGVPSGAGKHVVERYRLAEDGTRITVEFVLEDPEYIAEPMTHSRELVFSPHLELSRFDCDPEVTRRFVP